MEFVLMERLWSDSSGQDSYDPYTCAVRSAVFLECLDIAGPRTLGNSLSDTVAYNMTGSSGDLNKNFYAVLALEGLFNMTGANASGHFGGDVACNGKTVGDGAVNAYDLATLMWYQFKFEPYDQLPNDPSVVATVRGRDDTGYRCGIGETRRMWQVAMGDDYCHNGQNAILLGYDSQRRLSQGAVVSSRENILSDSLFEPYRTDGVGPRVRHLHSLHPDVKADTAYTAYNAKETRLPEARRSAVNREDMLRGVNSMRSLDVDVVEWAIVRGYGRWIRLRAPGVQVAMELYMSGVSVDYPVHLSMQRVPGKNCTMCAPQDEDPRGVVVAFARRTEYEDEYANVISLPESSICANIVPATVQSSVMIGNTIAVRQQPPNTACGFDIFLWIPAFPLPGVHISSHATPFSLSAHRLAATGAESAISGVGVGCDSDVGVLSGSSAMDGFRGQIQRVSSCTRYGFTRPDKIVTDAGLSSSLVVGGQCTPQAGSCNAAAPARNDLVSRSFHSSASSGLESAYTSSLHQLVLIPRAGTQVSDVGYAAAAALFEAMLARDSETNDCCQGYVCTPLSQSNASSNGMCQVMQPSPAWPPPSSLVQSSSPSPPLSSDTPHWPPPSPPPSPLLPEVMFVISVVGSAESFNDTDFKLNVAWSVGVSTDSVAVELEFAADSTSTSLINVTTIISPLAGGTPSFNSGLVVAHLAANVLANTTVATQILGVQVQHIVREATVVEVAAQSPSSPPPMAEQGSMVVAIVLSSIGFVVVLCAAFVCIIMSNAGKNNETPVGPESTGLLGGDKPARQLSAGLNFRFD
jgi:hypothetical protein